MIRFLTIGGDAAVRGQLMAMLAPEPDFEFVGEATDGLDALQKLEILQPDVAFVDVNVPKLSGWKVIKSPDLTRRPYIIIVAEDGTHAVRAFDANAVDYLIKPINPDRLKNAIVKLRRNIDKDVRSGRRVDIDTLMAHFMANSSRQASNRHPERIPVKFGRRYRFINSNGMRYIVAKRDFVDIHMITGEVIHASDGMVEISKKLASDRFLRIHRSVLLNIEHIREVRSNKKSYEIIMTDKKAFHPGSTYITKARKALMAIGHDN